MFGYVTTNQEELKIKDFRRYQDLLLRAVQRSGRPARADGPADTHL